MLLLRYMFDFSHREVAAILERSPEDVRILQHRAQAFLRERLSAIGQGPSRAVRRARMRAPTCYSTALHR